MQSYILSAKSFTEEVCEILLKVSSVNMRKTTEIRMRKNKPLILCMGSNSYFLSKNGSLTRNIEENTYFINERVLNENFLKFCNYSVYSSLSELKNGYVTVKGGNRVGVCASAIIKDGEISGVKNITSLNFRIARQVDRCSLPILKSIYNKNFPSIIIAGPPCSGKTTVLRDLAYQVSSGFNNKYLKVCITDERGEFASMGSGFELETGFNCDVLSSFSKEDAIDIAIRTLSPQLIVCDEITKKEEIKAISKGFASGVSFAVSVHIGNEEDLFDKKLLKDLLNFNEFKYMVLLSGNQKEMLIVECEEVLNEINRRCSFDNGNDDDGNLFF